MQVQEELIRRSTGHVGTSAKKRNFSCSHPFSQIVFCGDVEKYIEEFIGTTVARNLLFGDASVDWRTQA